MVLSDSQRQELRHRPSKPKKTAIKDFSRLLVVIGIFGGIGYLLSLESIRDEYFNVDQLRDHYQNRGIYGLLSFVLVGGILTGFGVPRLWVSALAGWLYGAMEGTAVALITTVLGATLAFLIARWLLRGPIKRRMPRRLVPWYERFNQNGFRYMLIMRLFPLSVAMLTNLLGGVSRMSYVAFLGATTLGYLPLTIVFALFGKGATGEGFYQLIAGAGIMILVVVGERLLRQRYNYEIPADEENPANYSSDESIDLEAAERQSDP